MAGEKKFLDSEGLKLYHEKITEKIEKGDSLSSAITVDLGQGGALGGFKTGDIIAEDTSLEYILKKMLTEAQYADSVALEWGDLDEVEE